MIDVLLPLDVEMARFLRISELWGPEERFRVLCGHLGSDRMREMNDALDVKASSTPAALDC